jgi:hypothetical protein
VSALGSSSPKKVLRRVKRRSDAHHGKTSSSSVSSPSSNAASSLPGAVSGSMSAAANFPPPPLPADELSASTSGDDDGDDGDGDGDDDDGHHQRRDDDLATGSTSDETGSAKVNAPPLPPEEADVPPVLPPPIELKPVLPPVASATQSVVTETTSTTASQTCSGCALSINPEEKHFQFRILDEEAFYHVACFACFDCGIALHPETFKTRGVAVYCSAHFAERFCPRCGGCNEPITTDVFSVALGKSWHKGHFKCFSCGKQLQTDFVADELQRPFCNADCFSTFEDAEGAGDASDNIATSTAAGAAASAAVAPPTYDSDDSDGRSMD